MRCTDLRERLLEADPEELRGETASDLAVHLTECQTCRKAADRILEAEEALRAHLASVEPGRPPADLLPLARRRVQRRRQVRRLVAAVPALAAAGIAIVFAAQRNETMPGGPIAASIEAPIPLVSAAASNGVAVIETDNPNIVIVWTF